MFILAKILKRTDSSCIPKSLNFPFFPVKCISGIIFEFCMYIWTRAYNYMYITDTAACNPEKSWRTEIRYLWPITFLYIISFEISYTYLQRKWSHILHINCLIAGGRHIIKHFILYHRLTKQIRCIISRENVNVRKKNRSWSTASKEQITWDMSCLKRRSNVKFSFPVYFHRCLIALYANLCATNLCIYLLDLYWRGSEKSTVFNRLSSYGSQFIEYSFLMVGN